MRNYLGGGIPKLFMHQAHALPLISFRMNSICYLSPPGQMSNNFAFSWQMLSPWQRYTEMLLVQRNG